MGWSVSTVALDRSKWGWWLLCLLLKQLPQETRPLPGAPPVGTAQPLLLLGMLQVLVLCATWFPKACAMPHRVDRRSGWPPAREYVSLFGLDCSLDTSVSREDLCPLGRQTGMSDLGQLGRPEFRVGAHPCYRVFTLSVCFVSVKGCG